MQPRARRCWCLQSPRANGGGLGCRMALGTLPAGSAPRRFECHKEFYHPKVTGVGNATREVTCPTRGFSLGGCHRASGTHISSAWVGGV